MKFPWLLFLFILTITSITSCFRSYYDRIKVDGSSTLFPLTEAVSEEFRKEHPEIKVTVGVSGTGGGFKKFSRSEISIAAASRPISESEIELCKKNGVEFIEIPVSYDGLVIAVNKGNHFINEITVKELKKIWEPSAQRKIRQWSDIRKEWPSIPIRLFGAGTSSGSFDYFTAAIVGEKKASRGDYSASEDDNLLVQGVMGDKGAMGYFGFAYYSENKNNLKLIPVDDEIDKNGIGPIFPNDSTILNGIYQPLARPEFIYINVKDADNIIVKEYVEFYLKMASTLVKEVGGVPLPAEAYDLGLKRFQKKITGSMFNDKQFVALNIVKLLNKGNE